MSRLRIEGDGGEPTVVVGRPATIGGPGCDVVVSDASRGVPEESPLAHLAWSDGELFVQPVEGGARLLCNGEELVASRWLRQGDRLSFAETGIEVSFDGDEAILSLVRRAATAARVDAYGEASPSPGSRHGADGGPVRIRPAQFSPRSPILTAGRRRGPLRPARLLWLVLAAALVGGAGWLWSSTALRIVVEPMPESLSVSGASPVLHFGSRYLLRPGEYELVADKSAYRTLRTVFQVGEISGETQTFRLEPLPGRLEVVVEPQAAVAEISIDGELAGTAPLPPVELLPGEHTVEVTADGYLTFTGSATVGAAGSLATLEALLVEDAAPVTFDSIPAGATIQVDGRAIGKTPLTHTVGSGQRRVSWLLAGFRPASRRVEVVVGQPLELPPVELVPADGNLVVDSAPAGASVTVDGAFRGRTPLDLELDPGRSLELRLSKSGYESAVRQVRVEAGRSEVLSVELAPILGEVEVAARPLEAELWVDGENRGPANQLLELSVEPHQLEVRLAGYRTFSQTVQPSPGLRQRVEVELATEEEVRAAATPEVIRTAAGQTMRLLSGGRFRLGASRREPGRRANESYREVELVRRYYLAEREVTNREFREFRSGHLSGRHGSINLEIDHHPVVRVSWVDAARYCNWLSDRDSLPHAYVMSGGQPTLVEPATTGYRLPSEAEWARAARFPEGAALKYPWGASLPVPARSGNFGDSSARAVLGRALPSYTDGFPGTSPPAEFSPNALGLYGLGDNVSEWMHDFYSIYSSRAEAQRDPFGPGDGQHHVIRGASWMDAAATELRLSYRDYGNEPRPDVGFRVARYAE